MACVSQCIHPTESQAHCGATGCHRTFGGVEGFDAHRKGGQCLDPAKITVHGGMRLDAKGIWRWSKPSPYSRAGSARNVGPQPS